ncbi:hypothetical protein V8G54_009562 [Vigna mungo]|uniref:Uncharacterized protein n=1 Tax=Vigna mungo TaxID=3915 RepID=A0AAQ3NVF6_VIGMU
MLFEDSFFPIFPSRPLSPFSFYAPPNLPFPHNLISVDTVGSLAIFDADDFVHLTTLSVHRNAAINNLALHPCGERTLTVVRVNCLAGVNLVRDRRNCCLCLDKTEDARILFEMECSKLVLCATPARVCDSSNSFFVFSNCPRISSWVFIFS